MATTHRYAVYGYKIDGQQRLLLTGGNGNSVTD